MIIITIIYTLLLPCFMIAIGIAWKEHGPKSINSFYGYRTYSSMKNKEHWDYAHKACSKVQLILGILSLIITIPFILEFFTLSEDAMAIRSMIPLMIQCGFLVFSIIPVEIMIRRKFKG